MTKLANADEATSDAPGVAAPTFAPVEVIRVTPTGPDAGRSESERSPTLPGDLGVTASTRAVLGQLIAAIRWCAVVLGTALVAADAVAGEVGLVLTNAVCLYLTTWRTMRPLRMGDPGRSSRVLAITDSVVVGTAIGVADGVLSPFTGCLLVAAGVASFGWGARIGLVSLASGWLAMVITALLTSSDADLDRQGLLVVVAMIAIVLALAAGRSRMIVAEQQRTKLAGRLDALAETNQLLHVLNRVARTLPSSLDLQQAVSAGRNQLADTFGANVICLVMRSDVNDAAWSPLLAEGMALAPTMNREGLPRHLHTCLECDGPILVPKLDGSGLAPASGSGIYTPLRTRGRVVGLLGVEHGEPDRYGERDGRLLAGLADALALTIDNARWFRRLRILGAEEERARIARDLHDRLGQWLTYISFELERIRHSPSVHETEELDALHNDVQRAIDELRETLRQMRTTVTEEQSLASVAKDLTERYARQSGLKIDLHVEEDGTRLPVAIENEVLRIMQEALTNIGKHAHATAVAVDWIMEPTRARLRVADDGDGFDESRGVRETAFGLVGMRERAEVIDAELVVTSSPGAGTTIELSVPREDHQ